MGFYEAALEAPVQTYSRLHPIICSCGMRFHLMCAWRYCSRYGEAFTRERVSLGLGSELALPAVRAHRSIDKPLWASQGMLIIPLAPVQCFLDAEC